MAAATEAATRPRRPEPHEAARSFAVVSEPLPKTTAKTTAKRDSQRENALPQTTAKPVAAQTPPAARRFAVADDLISDADLATDDLAIFAAAAVDSREWRIERRYRTRQDGQRVMYYNFRQRRIKRIDGKQRVEYLTGGKYNVAR